MNDPVPGRWYLNIAMPLRRTMRLQVARVVGGTVYMVDDPGPGELSPEIAWRIGAFRVAFRACEDVSRSITLPACHGKCACCDHPRFVEAASRAVRMVDGERAVRDEAHYRRRVVAQTNRLRTPKAREARRP